MLWYGLTIQMWRVPYRFLFWNFYPQVMKFWGAVLETFWCGSLAWLSKSPRTGLWGCHIPTPPPAPSLFLPLSLLPVYRELRTSSTTSPCYHDVLPKTMRPSNNALDSLKLWAKINFSGHSEWPDDKLTHQYTHSEITCFHIHSFPIAWRSAREWRESVPDA